MKRRVFVRSLAAMAAVLPFRRAHARARLQQVFDRAARDRLAFYATLRWHSPSPPIDKSAYPVALERWRNSMSELRAAEAGAGLTLAQRERIPLIMQMTLPFGFFGLACLCEIEKARRDMPYLHITDTSPVLGASECRAIRAPFAKNRHLADGA